jgi:hypothetical protein
MRKTAPGCSTPSRSPDAGSQRSSASVEVRTRDARELGRRRFARDVDALEGLEVDAAQDVGQRFEIPPVFGRGPRLRAVVLDQSAGGPEDGREAGEHDGRDGRRDHHLEQGESAHLVG